ncbi:MAG: CoA-binding protein [Euryarchaeota archaeon]|nr:CoA-binding protein [Euryarchaeota archaeon]
MAEPSDEEIRELLRSARTIAVVGFSTNPAKDAHRVPKRLMELGYRVIPINPFAEEILGERSYPSLLDVPRDIKVDIVNVFRPAEEVPEIVEQAIQIGARALWLQLGITHEEAAERARRAGLTVVQNRCIKVEHRRLLGE